MTTTRGLSRLYDMLDSKLITNEDILEMAERIKAKEELDKKVFPLYILSSTNMDDRETCLFEADSLGRVTNWVEIDILAYRNGDFSWTNQNEMLAKLPVSYEFVKTITNKPRLIQHLYIKK